MPDPGDGPVIAVPRKRAPDGHVVAHGRRNGVCRYSVSTGLLSSRAVTLPPPCASPSRLGHVCAASPPQAARICTLTHRALVALVCGVEEGACTAVVVWPTSWIGNWHTQAPLAALGHVPARGG